MFRSLASSSLKRRTFKGNIDQTFCDLNSPKSDETVSKFWLQCKFEKKNKETYFVY
jgi:hypothetical protein